MLLPLSSPGRPSLLITEGWGLPLRLGFDGFLAGFLVGTAVAGRGRGLAELCLPLVAGPAPAPAAARPRGPGLADRAAGLTRAACCLGLGDRAEGRGLAGGQGVPGTDESIGLSAGASGAAPWTEAFPGFWDSREDTS